MINGGTAVGSGALSLSAVSVSLVAARRWLQERQVPLIGMSAAFLLVIQSVVHVPLGPGLDGHLIGGALVAILLGPWLGLLVVAAVALVETTGFGYGGVVALGANIALGLVAVVGGYALFRSLIVILPKTRSGFLAASAVTAWVTVVITGAVGSAMVTYGGLFGAAQARLFIPPIVLGHGLIGIAEAVITAAAVRAVMAARPDLMATRALLPQPAQARM
jgi:cobalt/nickel transport system permease protein